MASQTPAPAFAVSDEIRAHPLFAQALTHRSAGQPHNEVLEFLGDSVLNLVITDQLVTRYPDLGEGDLSRLRAWYVRGATLGEIARENHLQNHILVGEGERKSGGFRRPSILGDSIEALIGAVFSLGGLPLAQDYVFGLFADRLDHPPELDALKDPKSRLQEWLQGRGLTLPAYEITQVSGKAHEARFTVLCRLVEPALEAVASAASRRKAEQKAALEVIEQLRQIENG